MYLYFILFFILLFAFYFVFSLFIGFARNYNKDFVKENGVKEVFLFRHYLLLPYYIGVDLARRNPNYFKPHGVVIFTGRQGYGKSISMFQYATSLKNEYPLVKIISNTKFTLSDFNLNHWKFLVNFSNGEEGVIAIIDELQNWFNSKQSKNFPPEMLSVITQNRKNKRLVLGTAQQFYMISKDIRTQVNLVCECFTLFGRLTFVIKKEPLVDNEGEVLKMRFRGFYSFVQTDKLRDSYDTYATIKNLSDSGFYERSVKK